MTPKGSTGAGNVTKSPKPEPIEKEFDLERARENNARTPYRNLISHISGAPWAVDYYAQQVSSDDELQSLDVNLDPTLQQYLKIIDLELKVASYLNQTQNTESGSFDVTGESYIYPPLQPNKHDLFVADIGDGKKGLFNIDEVTRLTVMKESCFNVSYTLLGYAEGEKFHNLEHKVVKTSYFVKKLLQFDEDPLVVDEEYNVFLTLNETRKTLLSSYLNEFFNKRISSLSVPEQEGIVYDGNLVKFLKSFTDVSDNKFLKQIQQYTYELPGVKPRLTIFDAIIRHYESLMPLVDQKFNVVSTRPFAKVPQYNGIYYTKATGVIYPVDTDPQIDGGPYSKGDILSEAFDDSGVLNVDNLHEDYRETESLDSRPMVTPVAYDDFYVFSGAFYAGNKQIMSDLEMMVYDVINGKPIDQNKLHQISKGVNNWLLLDRFYYTPVVLLLIKMAIHGL